ncbi:MAG: protein archease [Planctomycetaceae bacterium]|nr:protein archease [Planctomycetaceae bacterium]
MYELFEHTADLGLRVRAADLNTLFAEAAACLFAAVVEDVGSVEPRVAVTVELTGTDREFLLFDWLRDLLLKCDEDRMVFSRFAVEVRADGLTGTAWGEPFDAARHQLAHEVKAITYHELKVVREGDEWLAEVIVDI